MNTTCKWRLLFRELWGGGVCVSWACGEDWQALVEEGIFCPQRPGQRLVLAP